jgi:hypothetical protein
MSPKRENLVILFGFPFTESVSQQQFAGEFFPSPKKPTNKINTFLMWLHGSFSIFGSTNIAEIDIITKREIACQWQ